MITVLLKTSRLGLLLAGLACLSFVSGQEPKAPATESLESLRGRAEKGDANAQFELGSTYFQGQGVTQDYADAVRWWRKSAEQGHAGAQISLGAVYAKGYGVTQDYVEAHMWFNLAASRASGDAQKKYAEAREFVAEKMSPAQIAEAQRRAREWKARDAGGAPPAIDQRSSDIGAIAGLVAGLAVLIYGLRRAWRRKANQAKGKKPVERTAWGDWIDSLRRKARQAKGQEPGA